MKFMVEVIKTTIKALRVNHGDAIVVEITKKSGEVFRILIDGGPPGMIVETNHPGLKAQQTREFSQLLNEYRDKCLEFNIAVLTHIDSDHIGGLLAAYRREEYRKVIGKNLWFNSPRLVSKKLNKAQPPNSNIIVSPIIGVNTSVQEAVDLDDLVELHQPNRLLITTSTPPMFFDWGRIDILSPTTTQLNNLVDYWETEIADKTTSGRNNDYENSIKHYRENDSFTSDTSVRNGSSIAMLVRTSASSLLLLADSFSTTVARSLSDLGYSETNKLKIDVCKISHHGSKGNTCPLLLSLIDCRFFIISTNGGKQLPNKQTIARILRMFPAAQFIFNYPELTKKIFNEDELKTYASNISNLKEITLP
jgi:beta-lactamase superfamily II metal-dependent hydrolase